MWNDLRFGVVALLSAFLMLVLQSVFAGVLAPHPGAPYLILPMLVIMATCDTMRISNGVTITFLLGVLMDAATGNALGVHTFAFVVAYVVARLASIRFAATGWVAEAFLSGVLAVVVTSIVSIIRAGFRSFDAVVQSPTGWPLVGSAIATALVSPAVCSLMRRWLPESRSATSEVVE